MRLLRIVVVLLVAGCIGDISTAWADGPVLDSMDALTFAKPKEKGNVELVEGHSGKALKFSFDDACTNVFAFGKVRGTPEWDKAAGFSFWVKGDGSNRLGGLQFVWNDDFALRYDYSFPISGKEWTKITVPWRDLQPVTCKPGALAIDPKNGNAPSKLGALWFGKWWYWRGYEAHSYEIDDIRLEPTIDLAGADFKPTGDPLIRVREKLKAGKPITMVTMGDSLTDFNHWANKPINWPTLAKEKLKADFKLTGEVTLINPAIGGTELRQNLVLVPRWLAQAPSPDLVTICFGYNDFSSGMRGPMYRETMTAAIDKVRRATGGKADVLVISSCRAVDKWDDFAELVEAAQAAAKDRNAGFADIFSAFGEAAKAKEGDREHLFCRDKVHLGPAGHEVVARTVVQALGK